MAIYSHSSTAVLASNKATTVNGVAGATWSAGAIVYLDTSVNKWKLFKNDQAGVANVASSHIGVAVTDSNADGHPIIVCLSDPEFTHGLGGSGGVAIGQWVVASGTAGVAQPESDLATGDCVILLVIPTTTTKGILQPTNAGATLA